MEDNENDKKIMYAISEGRKVWNLGHIIIAS